MQFAHPVAANVGGHGPELAEPSAAIFPLKPDHLFPSGTRRWLDAEGPLNPFVDVRDGAYSREARRVTVSALEDALRELDDQVRVQAESCAGALYDERRIADLQDTLDARHLMYEFLRYVDPATEVERAKGDAYSAAAAYGAAAAAAAAELLGESSDDEGPMPGIADAASERAARLRAMADQAEALAAASRQPARADPPAPDPPRLPLPPASRGLTGGGGGARRGGGKGQTLTNADFSRVTLACLSVQMAPVIAAWLKGHQNRTDTYNKEAHVLDPLIAYLNNKGACAPSPPSSLDDAATRKCSARPAPSHTPPRPTILTPSTPHHPSLPIKLVPQTLSSWCTSLRARPSTRTRPPTCSTASTWQKCSTSSGPWRSFCTRSSPSRARRGTTTGRPS